MKKSLLLFFILIIFNLPANAFLSNYFSKGIIFNNVPFTPETAGNFSRSFVRGERIYWLYMSKRPIKAQYIGIQVVSVNHKTGYTTISEVVYSHDYRINRDSPYYFTDYFVMQAPGHYYMQIFDKNKIFKPLTKADFFVR